MAVRSNDAFNVTARGQYIYQQYQSVEWLKKYGKFIDDYIQKNYFDKLRSMWDAMDVAESLDAYLTFYTKHYFGLHRPLASSSLSERWDIGLNYDDNIIYDDAQDANGLITGAEYLKYIKFIYDYTNETWHPTFLLEFIANYCNISPTEIWLDFSYKNEVRVKIPVTEETQALIKLIINHYDEMCLPFPNVLNVMVLSDAESEQKRYIIYSPYSAVMNRFPNISTLEAVVRKWQVEVVLATTGADDTLVEYKIIENRSYACLQEDKSIDILDVTPRNLANVAYWEMLVYKVGTYVYIAEDSTISAKAEQIEGEEFVPLYTAGVYQCIADDYDVHIDKVMSYGSLPDEYPESGVPLCFDKYVDVTKDDGTIERVPAWATKWQLYYTKEEADAVWIQGLTDLAEFRDAYPIEFIWGETNE